ncbi:hypothetical protein PTT_11356 [Paecilomyces variotii No. 5]|uniref:Tat pathway signal sequence n=1 Tax=Byssochlamys spectabilis (strain No. 5 / NBRC 109023) TaxID=1356009 RepID=V5FVG6_BYSSN|nr:hypothetical protein PTT_11356 [Paecilomyces variotii No. 5]
MFIAYNTVTYNGSLLKENIYKKAPAPEVDVAWDALAVQNVPFIIPEDQGERYGLSKSHVKRRPEAGGGYPVYLEAMHHLHCLNLLRQTSYWNYEYYLKEGKGPFVNSEPVIKFHAGHCLDILRQQLMCKADLSVFGQVWVRDYGIYPDFDTKHRCKNFEAISDWVKHRQLKKQLDADGNSIFEIRDGDEILDEIP